MKTQIIETFLALKEQKPLVHNITNFVVMNNTANALLAIGASPIMAHALDELEDMINIAASLVINMGTIDNHWFDAMLHASKIATQKSKPWVFDPVGVGASNYRTDSALTLLDLNSPSIIRANASEIMALANTAMQTKGVDSTAMADSAVESANILINRYKNTVVISGETDFILSANKQTQIHNGAKIMSQVTGMGCTATAITGACLAVSKDTHIAATTAMAIMGAAGEIAKDNSTGPGSFQVAFIDALYNLTPAQLGDILRITDE